MNSQAMIVDCAIRDNRAEQGGGAYLTGTPTFTNCTFSGNQADASGGGAYVGGAAAFTNCTIANNFAGYNSGGGVRTVEPGSKFVQCDISGNACLVGAGVYSFGSTFISCRIGRNGWSSDVYGVGGGAVADRHKGREICRGRARGPFLISCPDPSLQPRSAHGTPPSVWRPGLWRVPSQPARSRCVRP